MDKEVTLSPSVLHNNIDYCLYEGMEVKGFPIITIAKGNIIVEDGQFKGERGAGRFLKRKINPLYLQTFAL